MFKKALILAGALWCVLWFSANGDAALVEGRKLDHGIVYLKIITFNDLGVGPGVVYALHAFGACQGETDTKMILDLRNNFGGFLKQAARIVALFVKPSLIVELRKWVDGKEKRTVFETDETGPCAHAKRVVLVNKYSASASEIMARVLQADGALLIGEDPHTFGKGTFTGFEQDSKKILFEGRYYFANGEPLPPNGLTPNIITGRGDAPQMGTPEFEKFMDTGLYDPRDLALERAIKYLSEESYAR